MPVYKLDLNFFAQGYGWRESYYRDFSGSLGSAETVARTLADKRAALMGSPVVIEGYTVTDPLIPGRQGETIYFNPVVPAPFITPVPGVDIGATTPSSSINVAWSATGNRRRRIWMRGVYDAAITFFNQLSSSAYGVWYEKFLQYRTYVLQQQFGWLRDVQLVTGMCDYTYPVGALVPTITFTLPFFTAPMVGTRKRVGFSRFNGGHSPLNRVMIVDVISTTVCKPVKPVAAQPQFTQGQGILYDIPQFIVADNLGVERVGRRAPGRPLYRSASRSGVIARS